VLQRPETVHKKVRYCGYNNVLRPPEGFIAP
jgi:hypothetical protein